MYVTYAVAPKDWREALIKEGRAAMAAIIIV